MQFLEFWRGAVSQGQGQLLIFALISVLSFVFLICKLLISSWCGFVFTWMCLALGEKVRQKEITFLTHLSYFWFMFLQLSGADLGEGESVCVCWHYFFDEYPLTFLFGSRETVVFSWICFHLFAMSLPCGQLYIISLKEKKNQWCCECWNCFCITVTLTGMKDKI